MENQHTSKEIFDLAFDESTKQSLRNAAVTGGIAAIIAFSVSILKLVSTFIEKNRIQSSSLEGYSDTSKVSSAGAIIGAIISFGIAVLLFYFLNRFSKLTKSGIDGNGQSQVTEGLGALATYFKTIGILVIIGLAFVLLGILAVGITGK